MSSPRLNSTSSKQEQVEIDPKLPPPASLEEVDWTNYDFLDLRVFSG